MVSQISVLNTPSQQTVKNVHASVQTDLGLSPSSTTTAQLPYM